MLKIFILLGLLPFSAEADPASSLNVVFCETEVFLGFQIKNYSGFKELTCKDVQPRLETAFKKVQSLSPVELNGPMLVISNREIQRGGTYSWETTSMAMGIDDLTKMDDQIVTFYHEMGHKIYAEYFMPVMTEAKEKIPIYQKHAAYLAKCQSHQNPPSECSSDTSLDEVHAAHDSYSKEFDQFLYIDKAYNELFADVVAALAAEDPDAMAKAVGPCDDSVERCGYRTFLKNTIDRHVGTNAYSLFSPLRQDLWDTWVIPRFENKAALLDELAQAFVLESTTGYKEHYTLVEGMAALKELRSLKERLKLQSTGSATL